MNERNVDAMTPIISSYLTEKEGFVVAAGLAAYLSNRGVLVPSTLTDEQIWRFDQVQMLPHTEEPAAMRAHLEWIAKGGNPPALEHGIEQAGGEPNSAGG